LLEKERLMAVSASDTTDRLRKDIDRGRTGDKVDWPDPAAAPLGTDDEAGGTPPSRDAVAQARAAELRRQPPPARSRSRTAWIGSIVIAGSVLAATIGWLLWR
jgi:hypothetical protein